MVWSGPPFHDDPPVTLSWAAHRAAGHVALALLGIAEWRYGGSEGLVALDAGSGRYVQARNDADGIALSAANGSFALPRFRQGRARRQAMRRLRWDPPGPPPAHWTMKVAAPNDGGGALAALLLDTLLRGLGVEPAEPVRLQLWRHKPDERRRTLEQPAGAEPPASLDGGRWRPEMYGFRRNGLLDADLSGLLPFVLLTHDGPTWTKGWERNKPGLYWLCRQPEMLPHEQYGEGILLPLAVADAALRAALDPVCAELEALGDETTVARRRRAARLLARARVDGAPLGFRVLENAPARGFVELDPGPALFRRLRASFRMATGLGTTRDYPIRLKDHAPFPWARPAELMEWVWHDRGMAWHPFRAYLVTGSLAHLSTFRRVRLPGSDQATPALDLVPWFRVRGRVASMQVRAVQDGGVFRVLLATGRQRVALDLPAGTAALAALILWLKRLAAGDLPARVDLPVPGRAAVLQAAEADHTGRAFLVVEAGGATLQAVIRPAELARAARQALMAATEDGFDHTCWPMAGGGYPPHVVLPDPWFDDAISPGRGALLDEMDAYVGEAQGTWVFRNCTVQRLHDILAQARPNAARPSYGQRR